MSNEDIHSVILNFNKNFSNSKGYNFTQIVNNQLELKPNTMVALYNGNIVRKPIVVPENTNVEINLTSILPRDLDRYLGVSDNIVVEPFPNKMTFTMTAGTYSKLSFCRVFCERINTFIESNLKDLESENCFPLGLFKPKAKKSFPYKAYYNVKDGNFFLGLRYNLPTMTTGTDGEYENYKVGFKNLDDECNTSQAITFVEDNFQTIFHRTTRLDDWNSYALGNQAMKSMSYCHTGDNVDNKIGWDVAFSSCQVQAQLPGAGTQDMEFLYALNNTYFASEWADQHPANVATSNLVIEPAVIPLPKCLIGAYIRVTATTTDMTAQLYIVANEELEKCGEEEFKGKTERDNFNANRLKVLKEIDLDNFNVSLTELTELKWEIYCVNAPELLAYSYEFEDRRLYYIRLLTQSPYENSDSQVLFDSKSISMSLNNYLVESGTAFQLLKSVDVVDVRVTGGLCPQFFFKNTNEDFVVYNPRQNSTSILIDNDTNFMLMMPCDAYSFEINEANNVNTSAVKNILGVSENFELEVPSILQQANTIFNPNNYPTNAELAGLTQLGSDRQRYNIELNLPIRAFNTTESSVNNLGQTRTIIFNTNPVVDDVTNVSTGLINGTLDPNNLKFLSLNNDKEIKLNHLDLTIRRSKNNELATEIIDSSIELLFKSPK